jgi:hypothetical protein
VVTFPATAGSVTPVQIARGSAALPGQSTAQEIIGAYLGSSGQHLYVGSPGRNSVSSIPWSSLSSGNAASDASWTAGSGGIPAGVAFGSAVS